MILSKETINFIQANLEPGYVLELTVDENEKVSGEKRPPKEGTIHFAPTLLSAEERITILISALKPGQDPIHIHQQMVEPNTWIRGLLTCKGISQEMENGS